MSIAAPTMRPVEILLVEDNPADVRLVAESLAELNINNHLTVIPDGVQALAYCRREGVYAHAARPDLVLLDFNLPKCDGREVLARLKQDDQLKSIPVIVLTTSKAADDVAKAHELKANCFIAKPVDFRGFLEVMRNIEASWCQIVTGPAE
jgi:CheY-like chemotaxis protein